MSTSLGWAESRQLTQQHLCGLACWQLELPCPLSRFESVSLTLWSSLWRRLRVLETADLQAIRCEKRDPCRQPPTQAWPAHLLLTLKPSEHVVERCHLSHSVLPHPSSYRRQSRGNGSDVPRATLWLQTQSSSFDEECCLTRFLEMRCHHPHWNEKQSQDPKRSRFQRHLATRKTCRRQ